MKDDAVFGVNAIVVAGDCRVMDRGDGVVVQRAIIGEDGDLVIGASVVMTDDQAEEIAEAVVNLIRRRRDRMSRRRPRVRRIRRRSASHV